MARSWTRRALAAVAVSAVSAAALIATDRPSAAALPGHAPTGPVVLYGDSLGWEAQGSFRAALEHAGIQAVTETFGGTAICDWLPRMRRDALLLHPTAVVVEFSGNALTPCMHGVIPGTAGYYGRYEADAEAVIGIFSAVPAEVLFVGTPLNRRQAATHDPNAGRLNRIYRSLRGARYSDAGAAVLDHGRWTATLPCLPGEPCADVGGVPDNAVRAPDGAHFCPVAPAALHGVVPACPVWSSGAYRFGSTIADAVLATHDVTQPAARSVT